MAGFLDVEPASPILCASSTRNGVNVFFTAKKAYNSQFLGMPYIYDYVEPRGELHAVVAAEHRRDFVDDRLDVEAGNVLLRRHLYPADELPPVKPWIDDDVDEPASARAGVHGARLRPGNEVWWFFPQNGLTKNSRCIIYSYKEGWWSQALVARTVPGSPRHTPRTPSWPTISSPSYQHEVPRSALPGRTCRLPWAETYDLNLDSGSKLTTLKQLIPRRSGRGSKPALFRLLPEQPQRRARLQRRRHRGARTAVSGPAGARSDGYVDFRIARRATFGCGSKSARCLDGRASASTM